MKAKIFAASCEDGKVMIEGFEIEATILSEGVGSSTGIVILEGSTAFYISKSSTDLKGTLESTIAAFESSSDALTTVANTLTAIGTGMTGPTTAPPGALPGNVAQINAAVADLDSARSDLESILEELK